MRIDSSEFLLAAVGKNRFPGEGLPEIAFLGRSNVGKSSLINCLLRRRRIAQTSKSPGKTRTLNFYLVNSAFLFVDLPGYGFARVSKGEHASWRRMAEGYLTMRAPLRLALLLVDIRHPPTQLDRQMMAWLQDCEVTTVVVATKADKVSGAKRKAHLEQVRKVLPVEEKVPLMAFSSRTGLGRDALLAQIEACLS